MSYEVNPNNGLFNGACFPPQNSNNQFQDLFSSANLNQPSAHRVTFASQSA